MAKQVETTQTVSGDSSDNIIVVSLNPNDSSLIDITIDGVTQSYNINDKIVIDAKGGHDVVRVNPNVTVGLEIDGGSGNDRIIGGSGNDTILGGRGQDRINAGSGDDRVEAGRGIDYVNGGSGNDVLEGGRDNDVVYGGDGNDEIKGDAGKDYIEGGQGNDSINGGRGEDVISGGLGDDELDGGQNEDVVYGGQGQDTVTDSGINQVFAQSDDVIDGKGNQVTQVGLSGTPGSQSIRVQGTPEFQERVNADLDMLRSSPSGRQMLSALDQTGRTVTISQWNQDNGRAEPLDASGQPFPPFQGPASGGLPPVLQQDQNGNTIPGPSYDVRVQYNPSFNMSTVLQQSESVPATVLYHELSHAYNLATGTLQPGVYQDLVNPNNPDHQVIANAERQAVGLPTQGLPYDFDQDPATPNTFANPADLTENGLLNEQNRAPRGAYNLPPIVPTPGAPSTPVTLTSHSVDQVATDYFELIDKSIKTMPLPEVFRYAREAIQDLHPDLSESLLNSFEQAAAEQVFDIEPERNAVHATSSTLEIGV